mmetsp:Transcript_117936/g.205295  ORF Transcript_117936/g.205295 Transcript_117936/m.205295 type:complete len:111 (-) Transcript_117936:214-546(-)
MTQATHTLGAPLTDAAKLHKPGLGRCRSQTVQTPSKLQALALTYLGTEPVAAIPDLSQATFWACIGNRNTRTVGYADSDCDPCPEMWKPSMTAIPHYRMKDLSCPQKQWQ